MVAHTRIPKCNGQYKQMPRSWHRQRENQAAELIYDFHMALDAGRLVEAQSVHGELETGYSYHPTVAAMLPALRDSLEEALEQERKATERAILVKETKEWLKSEPLAACTSLVARNGKHRGEIVEMTVKRALKLQLREALSGPTAARAKRNGGHVAAEYCLDQIASEHGYTGGNRDDEAFRKEVERIAKIKRWVRENESK